MYNTFFVPIDLKSCPFCGESPYSKIYMVNGFNDVPQLRAKIACEKCHIQKYKDMNIVVEEPTFLNVINLMSEVTKDWNTRAEVEN